MPQTNASWRGVITAFIQQRSQAKLDKLFQDPALLRTPIVRNGKQATVGYCPEIWVSWS